MFRSLHWRLLVSYLGVMTAILGTTIAVMYKFVSYSLYQKIDRELVILADAAAHNLPAIQANPQSVNAVPPPVLDNDGDLDLPWQDLRHDEQTVEWFDANGQQLGYAGTLVPTEPLQPQTFIDQRHQVRSLTIPVTSDDQQLQGYVRVSASIEETSEELSRLLQGFAWGGTSALVLSGIGGWWLTQQSLKPIEQSFQRLKQFTADASHELRNPLTALRTSVEVMQNHPERIHPADKQKLKAIASATNQIAQLVDDLLLLARTDAAEIQGSEWIAIPLHELLEELVDVFAAQAEAQQIQFQLNVIAETIVNGNSSQLKRLFSNLILNALQYTPNGGAVTITMTNNIQNAIVTIEDTGIGITTEQLPFIFDRFWRANKARSHREGGLGLGLSIAQAIAHLHGGDITVTSQIGVGSCFHIKLPAVHK